MPAPIALVTGSFPPHDVCGVGDYTKQLFDALTPLTSVDLVHLPIRRTWEPDLFRLGRGRDLVHVQYPTEGWGKSLLPGWLHLGMNRAKLLLTLHEWSEMNRLRRASIQPLVAGADGFIFVTPFERDAFAATAPLAARRRPQWVIPIGITANVPPVPVEAVLAERRARLGANHSRLYTHFGFIHAAKQPEKLLDGLQALKARGARPKLLVIGGFQQDKPAERDAFSASTRARGLDEDVELTGFIRDELQAAILMAAADANVSLFAEGLSSRRSSFWYAAQHGNRLVTTTPRDPREFGTTIERLVPPFVRFIAPDAPAQALADALAEGPEYAPFAYPPLPAPEWPQIAREHVKVYREMLDSRI